MHSRYMSHLNLLGLELSQLCWYEAYVGAREALKIKTAALVGFDRKILLAQREHDASECARNPPITGDSKDMAGKRLPQFLCLDGNMYQYTPVAYGVATDVIVKPVDEKPGELKYKVSLDLSDVDALLEKLKSVVSNAELARSLVAHPLADAQPFTLQNNGSINITASAVDSESLEQSVKSIVEAQVVAAYKPGGIIWNLINK